MLLLLHLSLLLLLLQLLLFELLILKLLDGVFLFLQPAGVPLVDLAAWAAAVRPTGPFGVELREISLAVDRYHEDCGLAVRREQQPLGVVAGTEVLDHVWTEPARARDTSLLGFNELGQYHIRVIRLPARLSLVSPLLIDDALQFLAPIDNDLRPQIADL